MENRDAAKYKEFLIVPWFFVSVLAWAGGLKLVEFLMHETPRPQDLISGFLFFSSSIGLLTSVVQWPFLRSIGKLNFLNWVGLTTLGFALGGVLGVFSAGLLSGLPVIALQIVVLRGLKKDLNAWVIVTLVTSAILGVLLFSIVFLTVIAIEDPFSTQILVLTGVIYAFGTTIAFSHLCK